MITGPRRSEELDGPQEMHLVLLDNGRSQAYAEDQMRRTLQCIRCGACMNHCPVYTRIGGAAYGTTYPGPIGEIISSAFVRFGCDTRSADCVYHVRRVCRSLPGTNSDYRTNATSAR